VLTAGAARRLLHRLGASGALGGAPDDVGAAGPPVPPQPGWTGDLAKLVALGALFALILTARNPQVLLHPEFWAEDGWVWFPDGYEYGLASLARPVAGYLQTAPRLVGLLAQAFPLAWAPAIFALAALVIQVLPPLFLASSRMAAAWPDTRGRLLFALVWLVLPNTREIYVNLTNAQWHIAALGFLVLLSRAPATAAGRGFDTAALAVCGLSGPFCIVLAPVAAWLAVVQRTRTTLWRAGLLCAAAAVQAGVVVATVGERGATDLGGGPRMLARIVAQQVMAGALVGEHAMPDMVDLPLWQTNVLPLGIAAVGLVLAGLAVWHGRQPLRLLVLVAALLFAAALARPVVALTGAQWPLLQVPGVGQRYYYAPMLALMAALFTLAGGRSLGRRAAGCIPLLLLAVGIPGDFALAPRVPTGFAAQAKAFGKAAPGTVWLYPFNPFFERFPMRLVKR